jgi:hypothetical protein
MYAFRLVYYLIWHVTWDYPGRTSTGMPSCVL